MKRFKRIFVLLGILVIACAATFAVTRYEEKKEQIQNTDAIILELARDEVTSLSWEYETEALSFHKDTVWLYDEDENFPVDEEKIGELLEVFEALGASFIIEAVEDYSQYGLEEPTCTINLSTADQTCQILLGNFSNMDSQRYVSIGDGNVYLVSEDPMDHFDAVLSDMIDHDELPTFDQVTGIQFTGSQSYNIFYEEESTSTYCPEDVYFVEQDEEKLPLDTSRVEGYLSDISGLKLADYVSYHASDEELAGFGLEEPYLTVTVDHTYVDESETEQTETFVLHVGREPETAEETEGTAEESAEEDVTAYVRVGDSRIIYQISSDEYQELAANAYDDLRHPEVLTADFEDIYQIDISLEEVDYTITSEEEEDGLIYYYQEEELDISDLESAVEALEAESFTGELPKQKKEISLTVHLYNENYPQVQVELYRYDGEYCLAVVDGEPMSLVERSAVVELIETVYDIVL